jgi:hypothetical protein
MLGRFHGKKKLFIIGRGIEVTRSPKVTSLYPKKRPFSGPPHILLKEICLALQFLNRVYIP